MTFNDKVVFEHFSFQRSLQCCAPSIVTRTRLCCYITFQCDIAHDWKAICVHNVAAKRRQGLQGLLDNFFTIVSKMPKGKCSTFWHFNSITSLAGSWLKGLFSRHKTTFKRVMEPEWALPGSTAGKICRKLVELKFNCGISWHFVAVSNFSWFLVKTGTF